MSFKVSRRAKSILASLLIASNFMNIAIQNVKGMENLQQNAVSDIDAEDFRCITDEFVADVFNSYITYKQEFENHGCSPTINKKFLDDFDYLNKKVFGNNLIHGFDTKILNNKNIIINFHPYLVVHTLKAFFDKNINIKEAFSFAHKRIPKLAFLLYDFNNTQKYTAAERIGKMLEKNNKQISDYGSQYYINNINYDNAMGNSSPLGYLGTLGINWGNEGFCEYSRDSEYEHIIEVTDAKKPYFVNNFLWFGLDREHRNNILAVAEQTGVLSPVKINGILYLIKTIIHEIAHSVCKYLGLLEKFNKMVSYESPINLTAGKYLEESGKCHLDEDKDRDGLTYSWNHCDFNSLSARKKNYNDVNIDTNTFDILVRYKKSYKPAQEFDIDYLGHSSYAATNTNEDIAEAIAYGSMPTEISFKGHKAMIKSYNIYAKMLLEFYQKNYEKI